MGNTIGKRRKLRSLSSKKYQLKSESYVVSLTSTSLNNLKVEFPKEIEEDLERRKNESLQALTGRLGSRRSPTSDPAHEMYEKMKELDMPAVMVPKPWSEVDQILSQMKPSLDDPLAQKSSPVPKPLKLPQIESFAQPETIDMWELMDDLEDEDDEPLKRTTAIDNRGKVTAENIRALESSLSFSTIHTIKEVEGGATKPETVTSILKARSLDSQPRPALRKATSLIASAPRR